MNQLKNNKYKEEQHFVKTIILKTKKIGSELFVMKRKLKKQ